MALYPGGKLQQRTMLSGGHAQAALACVTCECGTVNYPNRRCFSQRTPTRQQSSALHDAAQLATMTKSLGGVEMETRGLLANRQDLEEGSVHGSDLG